MSLMPSDPSKEDNDGTQIPFGLGEVVPQPSSPVSNLFSDFLELSAIGPILPLEDYGQLTLPSESVRPTIPDTPAFPSCGLALLGKPLD